MFTHTTLFALCCVLLGMPLLADAQELRPAPADQKYCTVLSKNYDRYAASHSHNRVPTVEGSYAKAACKQHHPLKGIPILQAKLEDSKVPLPQQQ
jgi:hypothetical protein